MSETNENTLPELSKIPEDKLTVILNEYIALMGTTKYVQYIFLAIGALVLFYNIFIAGNTYTYSEYNTIKMIMLVVACLFGGGLIVFGIVFYAKQLRVRGDLKEISERQKLDFKKVHKEFNVFVKDNFGGYPI
ncbi:hypothetical protein M4I21_04410 [Cellulophaga sp. 20_2_10]|uniref:hypothetical protein n=1 Tax=Cellulophaga sp. 20_2_10 TaxID=2942476 RepID=UPI00201B28D7|nr:hypothetical protein [Cellulophaga sp. 20_2_10]MCL5245037.1 hypothetical protein [Cellulophaga sp. 20_2_10]